MFETLDAYYEFIENDKSIFFDSDISNGVLILRDKTENPKFKSHCSYELYFTHFAINVGEIRPKLSFVSGETYPNFDMFDDDLEYIRSRAARVVNPKYKAKYNHLLWESKHKHIDYAKLAIDNYFLFLENVSFSREDNLSNHAFENYFGTLFQLCQTIHYSKVEVLQYFTSILNTNRISGYKEYSLMKFIVEEGKKITTEIYKTFYNYSNLVLENSIYPDLSKEYLQLLLILVPKLKISTKNIHNRLADTYIIDSEDHKESFIVHDIYLKALSHYKKAGNKLKIEEVTVLLEKAKRQIDFKPIKVVLFHFEWVT